MPELDKELQSQGYSPVIPTHVYAAAAQRPHGFLDAFMQRAKLSKGAFYILPEDLGYIRKQFPVVQRVSAQEAPVKVPVTSGGQEKTEPKKTASFTGEQDLFFNLKEPCPRSDWEGLRQKYSEELGKLTSKGCSSCQIRALKNKYVKYLTHD